MSNDVIRGPVIIGGRNYGIELVPEAKKGIWYTGKTKKPIPAEDGLTRLLIEAQTPQKWSIKPDNEYWLGKCADYGDRSIFRFDSLSKTGETYNIIFDADGIHVLNGRDYLKKVSPNERKKVLDNFIYELKESSGEGVKVMRSLTETQIEQLNAQISKYVAPQHKNKVPVDFPL